MSRVFNTRVFNTRMAGRRKLVLGVALALVGVATGGGVAASQAGEDHQRPASVPQSLDEYRTSGLLRNSTSSARYEPSIAGSPGKMAAEALSRLPGNLVLSLSVGAPPDGYTGVEEPGTKLPDYLSDARWLYATVSAPDEGPGALRAVWEVDLAAGAIRDARDAQGDSLLFASQIDVLLPDGTTIPAAFGGTGEVAFAQFFKNPTDEVISKHVSEVAAAFDLAVESLDVVRVEQAAPMVILTTKDPVKTVSGLSDLVDSLFGPADYEGFYLEVRDPQGPAIAISTSAFRAGAGRLWIAPQWRQGLPLQFGDEG